MARVEHYRETIQKILKNHTEHPAIGVGDDVLIFDTERDHYQLLRVGWHNELERILGIVVHIDIIDGKIWIQHDGIDGGVASLLIENGISKSDIVLGFQAPYKRRFTEFAVS